MGRNATMKQLENAELAEMMHRTNPVNQSAFKRGNAAGVHGLDSKGSRRSQRRQDKQEARLAARGIYSHE